MERWATFDCYGTLIDWNGGIGRELERLFGTERVAELLHRYHEVEAELQHEQPTASYRDILTQALPRLAEDVPADEHDALARALPTWTAFPEVKASLEDALARGWKLAILSNTDRDFIEASIRQIGVAFEFAVVASEIGSYKPHHGHWRAFRAQASPDVHVHVGASLFHDIAPAVELGLPTIWINRLGESAEPEPDVELHSLTGLGAALDSLA